MPEMTTAADAVLILFNLLSLEEQNDVFARLAQAQQARSGGDDGLAERCLRSLARVAEEVGHTPSTTEYRTTSERLRAGGEDVELFSRLYAHYRSWPRAREALSLAPTSSTDAIEARFRNRLVGKPWRYSEAMLRDALLRCAAYYDRPPTVAEFTWWRKREFELAAARGEEHQLSVPTRFAFTRRYGGWESALLHLGFSPTEVEERSDGRAEFADKTFEPIPDDLPVAELAEPTEPLPVDAEQAERLVLAYRRLSRRSRYVLTARLGLAGQPQIMRVVAQPLNLHLSRVGQVQTVALDQLCQAAAGDRRNRPDPNGLRDAVIETLRRLAAASEDQGRGGSQT